MQSNSNIHLHIIAFDIPYPPDYGGVIDVYYKLEALHQAGVKITLHTFEYGREHASELDKLCEKVFYYQRQTGFKKQFSLLPYSVVSRKNEKLIANLQKDSYPILFEGLVSCYYLSDKRLADRLKIYRESNIEHHYYFQLCKAASHLRDKLFFGIEAAKLAYYQRQLKHADRMLVVSTDDQRYLQRHFPNKKIDYLPSFHKHIFTCAVGQSDYILYHGNLAIAENEIAALYLCKNVFAHLPYKCILAGRNPSQKLQKAAAALPNVTLIPNPAQADMESLVRNAQIHLLVTFQGTGLKLKLLNVLLNGRHVVVNQLMLCGTNLQPLCHIANTPQTMIEICNELMQKPFAEDTLDNRRTMLDAIYDNKRLAQQLLENLK